MDWNLIIWLSTRHRKYAIIFGPHIVLQQTLVEFVMIITIPITIMAAATTPSREFNNKCDKNLVVFVQQLGKWFTKYKPRLIFFDPYPLQGKIVMQKRLLGQSLGGSSMISCLKHLPKFTISGDEPMIELEFLGKNQKRPHENQRFP